MTDILKDFPFAIAYLDYIIIFSKTPRNTSHTSEWYSRNSNQQTSPRRKASAVFSPRNSVSRTHPQCYRHQTITCQNTCHITHATTNDTKTGQSFPWFGRILQKIHQGICKIAKPLTLLTRQQVKFDWIPDHHTAFLHLKEAIVQEPILHYPNPDKRYIVYTDASDDTCRAQLSQEHNGTELPIAFLSHTFTETQQKWSTTEQEAYSISYTIMK